MFPKAGIWHRAPHGAHPALCWHRRSLPGVLLPLTCLARCKARAMLPGPALGTATGASTAAHRSAPQCTAVHPSACAPASASRPWQCCDAAGASTSTTGPGPPAQPLSPSHPHGSFSCCAPRAGFQSTIIRLVETWKRYSNARR